MIYAYTCPADHGLDIAAPMGEAPVSVVCPVHDATCLRDYSGIAFASDDDFRRAHLGTAIDRAVQKRGYALDPLAPKDKFEARHVERATGRRYIGDSTEGLSAKGQRAIERHKGATS